MGVEFEYWFQHVLSDKQRAIVELAVGPTNPAMRSLYVHPIATSKKLRCRSQKVKSKAYKSFSMFGLSIILITSFFAILLSEFLPWFTVRHQLKHSVY
jgi:hypothetical protein